MKSLPFFLAVTLLVAAGCSYQDFDKPLMRNPARDLFSRADRPVYYDSVNRAELERLREAANEWQEKSEREDREYALGVADEVEIVVSVPTQIEPVANFTQRVTASGQISCPLIGQVDVVGRTISELQRHLVQAYGDGYVKSPIITISVLEYNSKRCLVTGAVAKPGIYQLQTNRLSLVEALLNAGGVLPEGSEYAVVTRRRMQGEQEVTDSVKVNINALLRHSDLTQNVWVQPGDVVHVPPETDPKVFYVFGFANRQGSFAMPRDGTLSVLDAIANAGGISASARPDKAFLIRELSSGRKRRYVVNLADIVVGQADDIPLMPGDVLIVRTSWWRRYMEGVRYFLGFTSSVAPM